MAHLYDVQTNNGGFYVKTERHHTHMSLADFEKILLQAIMQLGGGVAQGLVIHRFTYKRST